MSLMFISGLLVFILFPVISMPLIILLSVLDKNKHKDKYIFIFSLFVAVIGLRFNNYLNIELDISRHLDEIRRFSEYNFLDFISKLSINFVKDMIFFVLGKLNWSHLLIPLTCMVTYYLGLQIVFYRKNFRRKDKGVLLLLIGLFIGIIEWTAIFSGIRYIVSLIIVAYAIYDEFITQKNKYNKMLLYIFALGIHIAAIIPIALVYLTKIVHNKQSKIRGKDKFKVIQAIIIMWPLYIGIISNVLSQFNIFSLLNMKIIAYTNKMQDINLFTIVQTIILISLNIYVYCKVNYLMNYRKNNNVDIIFYRYLKILITFTIPSMLFPSIGTRITMLVVLVAMPVIKEYLESIKGIKKYLSFSYNILLIIMLIFIQYTTTKGWFTLDITVRELLYKNIFSLLLP